jgi:hypothetical protein
VVDGSGAAIFVTVFAVKSKYTKARQKNAAPPHKLLDKPTTLTNYRRFIEMNANYSYSKV